MAYMISYMTISMFEAVGVLMYDEDADELIDYDDGEFIAGGGCPACGDPIDYCQGHGEIGDPIGAMILKQHDDGFHDGCHPAGCDDAIA